MPTTLVAIDLTDWSSNFKFRCDFALNLQMIEKLF